VSKFLLASVALALLGVAGVYPAAAQVTADPAAVKSGGFKLEPFHTQVGFTMSHLGISNYSGVFHDAAGTLTLDTANPRISKLSVTVPVASLQTTVPTLDTELKGKGWFDAATFPTATFVSTKVTRTGANSAIIEGDLTLHGVTKAVKLDAQLVGSGVNVLNKAYSVGFVAKGSIKRSDFGIKTYLPVLADDVDLTIQAAFEAQS
jgi:polyisoprenoid-binding protein YceI